MKKYVTKIGLYLMALSALAHTSTGCATYIVEAGLTCPSGTDESTYSFGEFDSGTNEQKPTRNGNTRNANDGRDSKMFLSYRVGGRASWPVADNLAFSSGLFLAGKGSKFEDDTFKTEEKTSLTYIDAPTKLYYTFGESGFNVNGGVQPSLLVGAKNTVTINGVETETTGTDNYNSFDIAVGGGVGYTFPNGILINLGYDLGLTNVINEDQIGGVESKNRVLHLSVGYLID